MKKNLLLVVGLGLFINLLHAQSYNPLFIPDTLSGTNFDLSVLTASKQFRPGQSTTVWGMNGNFCSPTLIFRKGDVVHLNVTNKLTDTTTIHWHGLHLPAMMDGGPHQTIAPNTTWNPYYKVMNNAATFWYHPHLHKKTEEQITRGLVGLIIVRDAEEAKLNLPRTYGVDDIPLMIADRKFDKNNQFVVSHYGDTVMVNRTLNPEIKLPAQVVRFRILNEATARAFNLGFSDNRTFYVITTDGGLVDAPVPVTRFLMTSGERVEILVDLKGDNSKTLDLKAFNSGLPKDFPGSETNVKLGAKDFTVLHINVTAPTTKAITNIPQKLVSNTFLKAADATVTRKLELIADASTGQVNFDGKNFDMSVINYEVNLNDTEIWELHSKVGYIVHPFHIHDVQFNILDRNGQLPPVHERGWKDVVAIRANETVRIIMKFADYADHHHPYMYHCHTALHEDMGMMGQFMVMDHTPTGLSETAAEKIKIYPNPGDNTVFIKFPQEIKIETIEMVDVAGKLLKKVPYPEAGIPIDISSLPKGLFILRVLHNQGQIYTLKYIKY